VYRRRLQTTGGAQRREGFVTGLLLRQSGDGRLRPTGAHGRRGLRRHRRTEGPHVDDRNATEQVVWVISINGSKGRATPRADWVLTTVRPLARDQRSAIESLDVGGLRLERMVTSQLSRRPRQLLKVLAASATWRGCGADQGNAHARRRRAHKPP
jgi:hypothetical protein